MTEFNDLKAKIEYRVKVKQAIFSIRREIFDLQQYIKYMEENGLEFFLNPHIRMTIDEANVLIKNREKIIEELEDTINGYN